MESLPSDYKDLNLSKSEKILIRTILSQEQYGYIIIDANPSMIEDDCMHVLITNNGILMIKQLDMIKDASFFENTMKAYIDAIHSKSVSFITKKLSNNKSLVDTEGNLKFRINIVYLFPNLDRASIDNNTGNVDWNDFFMNN